MTSTIVEIHLAYQSKLRGRRQKLSTIVEIHLAYQSAAKWHRTPCYLQQQKFIWLISPIVLVFARVDLQQQKFIWLISHSPCATFERATSTIVEIHLAYQSYALLGQGVPIYNSRNSFGLLVKSVVQNARKQSTIVEIHLAYQSESISPKSLIHLQCVSYTHMTLLTNREGFSL